MARWPDTSVEAELTSHEADTTNVHGIADTSQLLLATDSRIPTAGEKAALAGSSGTPGAANKYVTQQSLGTPQPSDSDLTDLANLTPTNDDIIQRKAGHWTNRTIAQLLVDLA